MSTADPTMGWPLEGPDDSGALAWTSGDASIRAALLNLLLTRPGERLMRPEIGAGITRFIHQPDNETTRGLLAGEVRRALTRGEPRIAIDDVVVSAVPAEPATVAVAVRYRLLADASSGSLDLTLDLAP